MRNATTKTAGQMEPAPRDTLKAVPHVNRAMELTEGPGGTALATIPLRRPWFLVPPLSWVLPYSTHRRVELDALGGRVLRMCDGRRNVESIIEEFAAEHMLSFREAQLAVGQFLRMLAQRGLIALAGREDRDEDR